MAAYAPGLLALLTEDAAGSRTGAAASYTAKVGEVDRPVPPGAAHWLDFAWDGAV
ncbi:hypothetical protein HMSSN036_61960 [Paenibacillus macerans]|nr:hypothetical protein HMSSN036_61960 [Paenibacillus macerans]